MPLRLEIKKKLSARSERVKCTDFHPVEPWILAALYSGHVFIWNYVTQTMVKSIEVCELPVRAAKFVVSKQWIVCGADDMQIRIYNYNTMERLRTFEAHTDYIRSIAIHPTLPYLISSSDDMFIKLWDWEKNWECLQIFEGHTHYVMQVEFNPKDPNTFASASLDRTVKIWGLNSPTPHFSLEGHDRGVNCIGYFRGGDRPYLVSGADDHLVKIWDYQTKTCVSTLDGHTNNVSSVCFHPELPIILSGSEDGTVRIWHANTYRLENTLNYGMERVWTISCLKGSNKVAIGYDDGTIMIKIGHEEPVASMERTGKLVWANNHEIVLANVKTADAAPVGDGDRLPVQSKELGSCELYPQFLSHSPNGRFICACGDGEYIIYTALSLKNKSFGSALEFVWASDTGVYATRESVSKVKVFKDFKEHRAFKPNFPAESIFGGTLLGIRSNDFIDFYDWNDVHIVRRIDVCPRKVFWSESGEVVVLACDASFYVLRYNAEFVAKFQDRQVEIGEQGIEGSFDLENEIAEKVKNGYFVGDCFIYTNAAGRLNYYVGGETMTLAHLSKQMYLLGYLPKENRVYLMDKSHNVVSYSLLLSVLVYQTAIVRRDLEGAKKALTSIPQDHYNRIARFLESQDLKELALEVSLDPEHKFELAMQCQKLELAKSIAMESESEQKWKQLGDAALNQKFNLELAEEAYTRANDLGGLLLLYSSKGDEKGLDKLAKIAKQTGRNNVAFLSLFLLHRIEDAIQLLCETDRVPEAAFLTRTYLPSHISKILALWKENLAKVSVTAAAALADPEQYADRFTDLDYAIKAEEWVRVNGREMVRAVSGLEKEGELNRNLIQELKDGKIKPVTSQQLAVAKANRHEPNGDIAAEPETLTLAVAVPSRTAKAEEQKSTPSSAAVIAPFKPVSIPSPASSAPPSAAAVKTSTPYPSSVPATASPPSSSSAAKASPSASAVKATPPTPTSPAAVSPPASASVAKPVATPTATAAASTPAVASSPTKPTTPAKPVSPVALSKPIATAAPVPASSSSASPSMADYGDFDDFGDEESLPSISSLPAPSSSSSSSLTAPAAGASGVPSLEEIDKSLNELDDEFRDFD